MNLDSAIDSLLSPIVDKISGIIFSSVTIHGVKIEFLVVLLMTAALYFTIGHALLVSGDLSTQ